jgi:putative membrane protein
MFTRNVIRGVAAAFGLMAVCAFAAQDTHGGSLSKGDKSFITEAAQGNLTEIEMGKLAQEKGQSQGVKDFGKRLEADHSKANEQLMGIAKDAGVEVPTQLDKKHQKDVDKLSKMKAQDFDKAFAKHMVSDHKKDIGKFQKEAKSAKDSELKNFASETLPTLQEHLKIAEGLAGQNKAASKSKGTKQ